MPNQTYEKPKQLTSLLWKLLLREIPRLLIPLVIFIGGIALLALKIPGWSIFLGLPATQIGFIFLIFTFDKVSRKSVGLGSLQEITCAVCGRLTLAPFWYDEIVCPDCRKKIGKKLEQERPHTPGA